MDQELAPGCFGSALTYQDHSPVCQKCPFSSACAPKSQASYERIAVKLGIRDKKRATTPSKTDPEAEGQKLVQTLPKKVREIMGWLERKKVVITVPLRNGVNPITSRPAFLKVACHLLLKSQSGVDHAMLKMAFKKVFDWNDHSAETYARLALQVLTAVGAISLNGERYIISKE